MNLTYCKPTPIVCVCQNSCPAFVIFCNRGYYEAYNLGGYMISYAIVIFVHGTILPTPSCTATIRAIPAFFCNECYEKRSLHDAYLDQLRFTSFYQYQPIGDYGLHVINHTGDHFSPTTFTIEQWFSKAIQKTHVPSYKKTFFYTFGWNGKLSNKSRRLAGTTLHQQLREEIDRVMQQEKIQRSNINVICIGHSHGGNVLLYMAEQNNREIELNKKLTIDTLVTLGTPIQPQTARFVRDRMFKRIFHLFSRGDMVQIADIISSENNESKRKFFPTQKSVLNIEVTIGKKKPLHNELWLAKAPGNYLYRPSLAIAPYPVAVFLPWIWHYASTQKSPLARIHLDQHKNIISLTGFNQEKKPIVSYVIDRKLFL